jgi:hypothetical protein
MADEIKRTIVGREALIGREAVIARCDKSAKFLETVSASIPKLEFHRADTRVVLEGAAQFHDQENKISTVASCDILQFSGERLVEITSYVIDLNKAQLH